MKGLISSRSAAGIQPFQSDFRGFLFNDQQLGVRLFGSRDNNRFQFNLGAFWRLEKDTNSAVSIRWCSARAMILCSSPTPIGRIS
jgi:hypothetical protein